VTDAYDPSLVLDHRSFFGLNAAGDVPDLSGHGHDTTPTGFAGDDSEYVDTCYGQGLYLTQNKYLDLQSYDILNFTSESFSFEFIYNPIVGSPYLVYRGTVNVSGYYIYFSSASQSVNLIVSQAGAFQAVRSANGTFELGQWVHLIVTRDGPVGRIYKDGIETPYLIQNAIIDPASDSTLRRLCSCSAGVTSYYARARCWQRSMGAAEVYERYLYMKSR